MGSGLSQGPLIHTITACWSHPRAGHGRAGGAAAKPRRTVITEQCGVLLRCAHSAEGARRLGLHSKGVCTLKRGHGALPVQSPGSTRPRPSRLLAESEKRTSSVLPGRRGLEKGAPAASPTLVWGPLLAARPGAPGGPGGCVHAQLRGAGRQVGLEAGGCQALPALIFLSSKAASLLSNQ